MVDVVFLLLIFFVVTFQATEALSTLDVMRPRFTGEPGVRLFTVLVTSDGYAVNGHPTDLATLDTRLGRVAGIHSGQAIVIECDAAAAHGRLVKLLDVCARHGLHNLSLVSR
jgi:biopolymer transport protein ExbD